MTGSVARVCIRILVLATVGAMPVAWVAAKDGSARASAQTLLPQPWPMLFHDPQFTNRTHYVGPQRAALRHDYVLSHVTLMYLPVVTLSGRGYMSIGWCEESNPFVGCIRSGGGLATWTPWAPLRVVSVDGGGPPIIGADGTRYQVVAGGLVAWAPTGGVRWQYGGLGGTATFGPGETIYWISRRTVTVLAQADGSVRRTVTLPSVPGTDVAVGHDGSIYYGSAAGLTAIGADGAVLWTFPTGAPMFSPAVVGDDGVIYAGGSQLHAINPDGTLRWSYAAPGMTDSTFLALGWNGRIHTRSTDGIVALDPTTGNEVWHVTAPGARSHLITGGDGTVYFMDDGGVGAIGPGGAMKWRFPRAGLWYGSMMAMGADGTLYISSMPSFLALRR